jgi:hypothetical protein
MATQINFRRCINCQLLFLDNADQVDSLCANTQGRHDGTGSEVFALIKDDPSAGGQSQWRTCHYCGVLYYAASSLRSGVCPAQPNDSTTHDPEVQSETDYHVFRLGDPPAKDPSESTDWRHCEKCGGLYSAAQEPELDVCPAGGEHSVSYRLSTQWGASLPVDS